MCIRDSPWIVGELDQLAIDRRGDRDRCGARQRTAELCAIGLPCKLEAAMFGGLLRNWLTQRDDAATLDFSNCKTGMRSPDIDRDDFHSLSPWCARARPRRGPPRHLCLLYTSPSP